MGESGWHHEAHHRPTVITSTVLSHSYFLSAKCEWKRAAHYARILYNESRWSKVPCTLECVHGLCAKMWWSFVLLCLCMYHLVLTPMQPYRSLPLTTTVAMHLEERPYGSVESCGVFICNRTCGSLSHCGSWKHVLPLSATTLVGL